jgi:hypothetical protein
MRQMRGVRLVGLMAVAVVVLVGIGVFMTDQAAPILDYRVRDDDTIVLTAGGGTNWVGTRVDQVVESDTTVRVWVRSFEWPIIAHGDASVPFRFVVDLPRAASRSRAHRRRDWR